MVYDDIQSIREPLYWKEHWSHCTECVTESLMRRLKKFLRKIDLIFLWEFAKDLLYRPPLAEFPDFITSMEEPVASIIPAMFINVTEILDIRLG
ncbi:hypothetical protein AVEN_220262-1 [Araneus ventricosus]|uniref:Uncharacterized protein n=1 Tax=Araneus ventricosus TaxID=182803 RepID=A0A4Y2PT23_ARAVE|nr:hypothetical protein AVEN_220262-1 [Araneus ventricosus]